MSIFTLEYFQYEPEGNFIDRKSARLKPKQLAEQLSAFANADGGKVVIGIEDDGKITGFKAMNAQNISVFIEAPFEYMLLQPKYEYERIAVTNINDEEDEILVFTVDPAIEEIITLKDQSVFLRINDKSRKLTHPEITKLEYDRGSRKFEDKIVEWSSIEDVNEDVVNEFREKLGTTVATEKLLHARGYMREGKLTVAGLLLFSDEVTTYFPSFRFRFLRYEGTNVESGVRMNIVKERTFDRALPIAIREAKAFIETQLRDYTFLGKEGMFVTLPEYPEFSWFEGMVNAIIHRDYHNQGEHIRIRMFDDRLEIFSPGNLPATVTVDNIQHKRYSRNPRIAAALTQYKWVRETNEGVGRIFQEMDDYFLEEPEYSEPNDVSVLLTLRNNIVARKELETGQVKKLITPEVFSELYQQEETIVRHLHNKGKLTASQAADVLGRSIQTARKWLNILVEKGIVEVNGSGPNDPQRYFTLKIK